MIKYPAYDNSILSLINSIEKHFGVQNYHPTLQAADTILEKGYRNVVLMVFDAMGSRIIEANLPQDSFLRRHMRGEISSVFPSTTTAALTTLESGLSPAEHTWLGWTLHFPEINDNVNVYVNTNEAGEIVADYNVAFRLIPYAAVIDMINRQSDARAESISPFGSCRIESLEELLKNVEKLCNEKGRHYLYTYWYEPDYSMHYCGIGSKETIDFMKHLDAELEKLAESLQDTVLFIISDHGQMEGKNENILDYPDIVDTLKWLPTIEPRALAFHVKDGREDEFSSAFLRHFGGDFLLLSRQEFLSLKLFGSGNKHPRFEEFAGDYMAVAISNISIFNSREKAGKFIGVHAGLTENEMMVPFIVVER